MKNIGIAVLVIIAVFILLVIISSLTGDPQISTSLGDSITISTKKDDCSGNVILGRTKESEDEISRLSAADDNLGLAKMILTGSALFVPNCTHAKVIGLSFTLRQVRILEGDKYGEAGWIPFEWARKTSEN